MTRPDNTETCARPNEPSRFLTLTEVLAIHEDQIARYGGSNSIRDEGGLNSALLRPTSGYYADCLEEAAALWESLAQNHPFIDGNKRTAFAVTQSFLALNGQEWQASAQETGNFIYHLYETNSFTFSHLLPWLRKTLRPVSSGKKNGNTALNHYQDSREHFSPLYQRLAQ